MNEKKYIETLKDKIEFYCGCRASALVNGKEDTSYHFHVMAQTTLDLLEEFLINQEKNKESEVK